MSSFCIAKATHIFSAKNFSIFVVSLDVNFNKSLANDVVSFEQLGPGLKAERYENQLNNVEPYVHVFSLYIMGNIGVHITKTRLFKYTDNFTAKKRKFSDQKF